MSGSHGGFQVRQRQPWKIWLILLLVVACLVGSFYLGKFHQAHELDRAHLERETLVSQISALESRNRRLVQENAHLEGGSKIEREAYQQANQELVRLQQELLAQKEELIFYRGIVAPSQSALGVNLQSFEVRRKSNQNEYSFKLILTKSGKSTKKVSGNTELLIRGESGGNVSELKLTDLVLEKADKNTSLPFVTSRYSRAIS